MSRARLARAADTVRAALLLVRIHLLFRFGGRAAVARATAEAMRTTPATQAELDARGVDAWHTARAVWRARRLLPLRSKCLHTALALRALFLHKGCPAVVRVGVRSAGEDAHAWVEIGDFVLDDQGLSEHFQPFLPRKQEAEL